MACGPRNSLCLLVGEQIMTEFSVLDVLDVRLLALISIKRYSVQDLVAVWWL